MTDFILEKWLAFGTATITVVAPIAFWLIRRAWKRSKKPTGKTLAEWTTLRRSRTDQELRIAAHDTQAPAASRIAAKMVLRTRQ